MNGWFGKLAHEDPALYGEPASGVLIHIFLSFDRFYLYLPYSSSFLKDNVFVSVFSCN